MNGPLLLSGYPCFVVSSSYFMTGMTGFGEMEPMSCAGLCSLGLYFLKERESSAIHWRLFIIIIMALRSLQTLKMCYCHYTKIILKNFNSAIESDYLLPLVE